MNGIDSVISDIRYFRPNILLENCADGGTMQTFAMAELYHTSISVDNSDSYTMRQGIYGQSFPFAPRYSARYVQDTPSNYSMQSAFFGGPLILQQPLGLWDADTIDFVAGAVAQYKRYRWFIRTGKVLHLIAPQGTASQGGGFGWDAIGSVSRTGDRAVAFVFRAPVDDPTAPDYITLT
jgi:alpha-galactosidase